MNETTKVLHEMFTTNTGRHFLDSGDAYGRHWETNENKSIQDFLDEPEATLEYGEAHVNLFHHLDNSLEYAEDIQAIFDKYDDEHPDETWFDCMATVAEQNNWKIKGRDNIYNHTNPYSQAFIWTEIEVDDSTNGRILEVVAIELHQGCDVRGGYTKPYFFFPMSPYWLGRGWEIFCPMGHGWLEDGYADHSMDAENHTDNTNYWHFEGEQENLRYDNKCPLCGEPLHVELFEIE